MRLLDDPPIIYLLTRVSNSLVRAYATPTNLLIPPMSSDLMPYLEYSTLLGGDGSFALEFTKIKYPNILN